MRSINMDLVAKRQEDIRFFVSRSSPVLVWSAASGIYLIAANKSQTRNRIYRAIDRIACVTRGEVNSGTTLARTVINVAWTLAQQRSIGDVHAHEVVSAVGPMIATQYADYFAPPLKAETVIVKLMETPERDFLSYTNCKGESRETGRVFLMGTVNPDQRNREREEQDQESVQRELLDAWDDQAQPHDIFDTFAKLPILQEERASGLRTAFESSNRREVVFLDRTALQQRAFESIFKRIDV